MNETNGTYYLYLIEGGWVIYHTYTSDQFRINVNNNINKSRPYYKIAEDFKIIFRFLFNLVKK